MDTTFDFISPSIIDAPGDLIVGSGNDSPVRVPVGTNGQVLTADPSQAAGVRWTTPTAGSGGGSTGTGSGGLLTTTWFLSGAVSLRTSAAKIAMPPVGSFELFGACLLVQAAASGSPSGVTRARFTADGTPIGTIDLPATSLSTTGWYKTSSDTSKRIFASVPTLAPEVAIGVEVIQTPTASVQPQNLSVQLWWRSIL